MARKLRTKSVDAGQIHVYLEKAEQFLRKARAALVDGDADTAGLLAVHAAISANDAVTGHYGKKRSSSEDHSVAASLLREAGPSGKKGWESQANRLSRIVAKKNLVAYEGRHISKKDSTYLVEQAERFVSWAREVVPS